MTGGPVYRARCPRSTCCTDAFHIVCVWLGISRCTTPWGSARLWELRAKSRKGNLVCGTRRAGQDQAAVARFPGPACGMLETSMRDLQIIEAELMEKRHRRRHPKVRAHCRLVCNAS